MGHPGSVDSERGMGGGRCCAEVMPGMGEERNPVSPAEDPLPAACLPALIPWLVSPGKTSPSRRVRLSGQVIRMCEKVGKGHRIMLMKGEEKSQLSQALWIFYPEF